MEIPEKFPEKLNSSADTTRIDWIDLRYTNSGDFRDKAKFNLIPADRNWIRLAQIAGFLFIYLCVFFIVSHLIHFFTPPKICFKNSRYEFLNLFLIVIDVKGV